MHALVLVAALLATGSEGAWAPERRSTGAELGVTSHQPAYVYEDVLSGEALASAEEEPTYFRNLRILEFQAKTIIVNDKNVIDVVHNNRLKRLILSSYPIFRDLYDSYVKRVLHYLREQSPKPSSLAEAEFETAARALRLKVQGRFKDFLIYTTQHGGENSGLAFLTPDLKLYILADAVIKQSDAQS